MNLVEAFLSHVESQPDCAALITPRDRVVTYAALARASAARALAMQRAGIGRGDIVLIARGVSPALYETLIGVFRLGAVAMFPEPAAGLAGVRHAVAAAPPKAMAAALPGKCIRLATSLRRIPLVPRPGAAAPGDGPLDATPRDAPALITFTSGSTGRAKGIVRSTGFLMLQHDLLEQVRHTAPGDIDLISLPVFILSNLAAGATSVIPAGRLTRPASLDGSKLRAQVLRHRVNRIAAPPAVCSRLVETPGEPLERLTAIFTGGGPVFPNLLHGLRKLAPRAEVHAVYGSTEAEPIAHVSYDDIGAADWKQMASGGGLLAGAPIPQIAVELIDNELWVAGPHVNEGYLDAADNATTKAHRNGRLWHRTGDAARIDEHGRLWLLGRASAAMDNLYPFAIEAAALSWPGVHSAALLAEPNRTRLAIAGQGIDIDDLRERAASLGGIELVHVNAIPMDVRHNSKIDYTRLRKSLR